MHIHALPCQCDVGVRVLDQPHDHHGTNPHSTGMKRSLHDISFLDISTLKPEYPPEFGTPGVNKHNKVILLHQKEISIFIKYVKQNQLTETFIKTH